MVARFPEMLAERVRDVLGLRFVDARLEDLEHVALHRQRGAELVVVRPWGEFNRSNTKCSFRGMPHDYP